MPASAAMLIGDTLLEHSLLLSTSLPESRRQPVAMHRFHRLDDALASLSARFTYSEFVTAAQGLGVSLSIAKRMLKKSMKM